MEPADNILRQSGLFVLPIADGVRNVSSPQKSAGRFSRELILVQNVLIRKIRRYVKNGRLKPEVTV